MSEPLSPAVGRPPGACTAAVGRLYNAHYGWLLGWLRRKLRCPHDAADLSHDTFVRLLNGEDVDRLREPRAYLLVIANRLMINRHRRLKVEEDALRQVAVVLDKHERRGPADTATARDLLAQVLILLTEEMPHKPRRAFLMGRVSGMSYRMIARRLGVSESSVKQYLSKCLAHCHARLYDGAYREW